ncbi:calcium-binding protein [Aureimonas phyllosphaerae]|uniref:Ca2+-binding RTX toxin-like protein n=1 Tax=Aureimonas phyllosphaerae TaxID=1166078 RepID=A0A7W6C083_9HYPH|nr:calcium-binding protein [Aureimonas phyllosphaerae]MBB3938035.1 Ca2+-binding RTX toxin-like protein [Aureimonas phyllosphaerae]MBB3962042.1 Ca2+-binding RTX toxin-like protein [Aureimonas phyllosphaerae]SFF54161.1 hypothetical protein SAMN05216566_12442 [Aureimonas phyllosphaerae]
MATTYNRSNIVLSGDQFLGRVDDTLIAKGYDNASVIGREGNDTFKTAGAGTFTWSTFLGGDGNDRLVVQEGDTFVGTTSYYGGTNTDSSIRESDILEYSTNKQLTMSVEGSGVLLQQAGVSGQLYVSNVERFVIKGSADGDVLIGSNGNDWLDGRGGLDTFQGSTGDDGYVFDNVNERVVGEQANGGNDSIWSTVSVDLRQNANIENLRLYESTNQIEAVGSTSANLITGNTSDNFIAGLAGNDRLHGKGGADTFAFNEFGSANKDTIYDFASDDHLALGNAFTGLNYNADGTLVANQFVTDPSALVAGVAAIIYNSATGVVSYDSDGAGGAAAEAFAQIGRGASLDNTQIIKTDFFLV